MVMRPFLTRRTFLADLGRGSVALAVLGVAGCAAASTSPRASGADGPSTSAAAGRPPAGSGTAHPERGRDHRGVRLAAPRAGIDWTRVNLGFVSAYILVRGGEAAVVDTGVAGSADDIAKALGGIGLDWDAVAHVDPDPQARRPRGQPGRRAGRGDGRDRLCRGRGPRGHPDGGRDRVDAAAAGRRRRRDGVRPADRRDARPHARPRRGPRRGRRDPRGRRRAGDGRRRRWRARTRSSPRTRRRPRRRSSKLGALRFETLLVGHGDPITSGAAAQVAKLAAG